MAESTTSVRLALRDLDREQIRPDATSAVVEPGKKVTLHFSLKLHDNAVIDSNFDKAPVSLVIGDGSMLPGFEQALLGLSAGESVELTLAAAQAFGAVNPDNQQRIARFQFPPDLALTENLMVEFTDAAGYQQAGRVVTIGARYVEIDFNHPLAGRDIVFSARIYQVEDSTGPAATPPVTES